VALPEGLGQGHVSAEMTAATLLAKQGGLHQKLCQNQPLPELMEPQQGGRLMVLQAKARFWSLATHTLPEGIVLAGLPLAAHRRQSLPDRNPLSFHPSHLPTQLPQAFHPPLEGFHRGQGRRGRRQRPIQHPLGCC
jgi:hypothetical protein